MKKSHPSRKIEKPLQCAICGKPFPGFSYLIPADQDLLSFRRPLSVPIEVHLGCALKAVRQMISRRARRHR